MAPSQQGFSLMECLLVMGILGILLSLGFSYAGFPSLELSQAQSELKGCLDHAFVLARASGRNVTVSLKDEGRTDVLPVQLPGKVKWGKPDAIPLPPGVDPPKVAGTTGEAHPSITVTPRRTATAALWFLNDGREALCLRLNGHGHVLMYRWRRPLKRWVKV